MTEYLALLLIFPVAYLSYRLCAWWDERRERIQNEEMRRHVEGLR